MGQHVEDKSADRRYFHVLPNIADVDLDPFEYRLLGHYKRVCGETGKCWEAVRTTAATCRMSADKVIGARKSLAAKGWVLVDERGTGRGRTVVVTLCDRWKENVDRSANVRDIECSTTAPGNVRNIELKRSKSRMEEEPIKKNTEEDLRSASPTAAADLYEQALADLATTSNKVKVLVDFARSVVPALVAEKGAGGRIGALYRRFGAQRVLQGIGRMAFTPVEGDRFSYLQAMLDGKGRYDRTGARGARGGIRSEADLDEWRRWQAQHH